MARKEPTLVFTDLDWQSYTSHSFHQDLCPSSVTRKHLSNQWAAEYSNSWICPLLMEKFKEWNASGPHAKQAWDGGDTRSCNNARGLSRTGPQPFHRLSPTLLEHCSLNSWGAGNLCFLAPIPNGLYQLQHSSARLETQHTAVNHLIYLFMISKYEENLLKDIYRHESVLRKNQQMKDFQLTKQRKGGSQDHLCGAGLSTVLSYSLGSSIQSQENRNEELSTCCWESQHLEPSYWMVSIGSSIFMANRQHLSVGKANPLMNYFWTDVS